MAMDSRCFGHRGISSISGAPALRAGGIGIDARVLHALRNSFLESLFSLKGSYFS